MKKDEYIKQCKIKRKKDSFQDYEILEDDEINLNKNINILHRPCNRIFNMKASNFKNLGYRCPLCYGNHNKVKYDDVKKLIEKDNEYTLLSSKYINGKSKLSIQHNICSDVFMMNYFDFSRGHRCPKCANNKKLTAEVIASNISLFDSEYECHDLTAKNAHSKIKIKHKICNNEFEMQYNNFKYGQRCPICSIKNTSSNFSKSFRLILKHLDFLNIKYELEKSFDDLRSTTNRKLRFDIFIKDLNLLIEYNGQQHYMYYNTGHFTKDKYIEIIKRDELKKEYALKNNYNYEVISYSDMNNYETLLENIINKYK